MQWSVDLNHGAFVRLRTGQIGLLNAEASAPVTSGLLYTGDAETTFALTLALDQLTSPNFFMQRTARKVIMKHDGHNLKYDGVGPAAPGPWTVNGSASSGGIELNLAVTLSPTSRTESEMVVALAGIAEFGEVNLPVPGMGNIGELNCDVDGVLRMRRA